MKKAYNTGLLCAKADIPAQIKYAEAMKQQIIKDLSVFYTGSIDITIRAEKHPHGYSVAADLLVDGEVCRTYDPADLCFLELNELMLKRMIDSGALSGSSSSNPKAREKVMCDNCTDRRHCPEYKSGEVCMDDREV